MQQILRICVLYIVGIMLGALIVVATIGLPGTAVHAQGTTAQLARNASTNSVTILILDMSGSMSQNDPDGLRCSAANAYIDLAGPGNFIGVIGLDLGSGAGAHSFQAAQVWAQPSEMATLAQRQQLQQIIATKSNNCRPDSSTPTYDALSKSLQMLGSATNDGQISGSVVLLTDGVPDPDTINQMNAVQSELLPQFRQHNWPIDTVALGEDGPVPGTNTAFHNFLSNLSDTTSGSFYDDGHGVSPGISPLNIADFFVNIFARHNHRVVKNDIPPMGLNGGTTMRNFSVTDYTSSLDIVVVKDQANSKASLVTPGGQVIHQSNSGVFISSFDPHYVIFSIDQPQAGTWELDVMGSGNFLMDSLKVSGIGMSAINIGQENLAVSDTSALALGQPLVISANLTNNGQAITDNRFTLNGIITYKGAIGHYSQPFALDDKNSPGTYTGSVTIPLTAPPGSYEIVINASTVSVDTIVANQNRSTRIERFPVPQLESPQSVVVQWDPVLRTLYSIPLWPIPQLSQWALNGPSVQSADIAGEVRLQQQLYPAATVSAIAHKNGSSDAIAVTVVKDGDGRFHVLFPASASGMYTLTFKASGTFGESHGDFGTSLSTVQIKSVAATPAQELRAWAWTLLYLLFLIFLVYLLRWAVYPHPQGSWICYHDNELVGSFDLSRATRNPWQGFIHRDWVYSSQARMPAGLLFRFRHGGGIEVRGYGRGNDNWEGNDGRKPSHVFREVSELRYRPSKGTQEPDENIASQSEIDESSTYSFSGRTTKVTPNDYGNGEENHDVCQSRSSRRLRFTGSRQKRVADEWNEDL